MIFRWRNKPPKQRRVIYTCLFGYSEHFNDFEYERTEDVDFVCFTDQPDLQSNFWQFKLVPPRLLDPPRASKRVKILAHRFVGAYSESLYLDNTIKLLKPPRYYFDLLDASPSPMLCFRHPWRNCIYKEAVAVLQNNFDDTSRVNEQMSFYQRLGYPTENGLTSSGFMVRRHNDPTVIEAMELWFEQVLRFSKRDQLSFKVAARQCNFEPSVLNDDISKNELVQWPVTAGVRLPRDFDDDVYFQLNPDVATAGVNARMHYLNYGHKEDRRYK